MSITNCDEFYLVKYKKHVEIITNKFIADGKGRCLNIKDDLLQEARIALLKWIRKQQDCNFEISKSYLYIYRALYKYMKHDMSIHVAKRDKVQNFYNKYQVVPLENINILSSDYPEIDYTIDIERWKSTLTTRQQKIVALRERGFNSSEIARRIGVSKQKVADALNTSIRNSYNAYFHPDQAIAPTRKRKSKSTAA